MTPKAEAAAYRIWAEARNVDWNCTIAEVAEAIDISPTYAGKIIKVKGWKPQFRASTGGLKFEKPHSGFVVGENRSDHPEKINSIGEL